MKEFLDGLDRERIVRWTAIYLVIYVVVNACLGLVLGVVGALAAGVGAMSAATIGSASTDAAAASTSLTTIGSFSVVLAIFYILSVPICGSQHSVFSGAKPGRGMPLWLRWRSPF